MILVTLLRHAIAVSREESQPPDDDRELTPDGRAKMEKASKGIVRILDRPDLIVTSPLIRARDTAEIVAVAWDDEVPVEESVHLLPGGTFNALIAELGNASDASHVMLVGHEPDLSRIAARLLGSTGLRVGFKKGGLCTIEVASLPQTTPGTLLWLLTPRQLRQLGTH